MTREEAVRLLKQYQGYEPMEYGQVLRHSFDLTDETVYTLRSALTPPTQEQLERVWPGCSFCKNDGVQDYRTAVCVTRWGMSYLKGPEIESDDIFYAQNHFCRFCGRPLTLEAWKEMRKRWEAANDAD